MPLALQVFGHKMKCWANIMLMLRYFGVEQSVGQTGNRVEQYRTGFEADSG